MSEFNMRLGLTQSLRSLVQAKYNRARASQSLIFSDTQLSILQSRTGIPFQLRYCPALSKKPTDNKQSSTTTDPKSHIKKFDPFEDPSEDLLITRLPNPDEYTHNVVLNKYPVIPNHFILATRENKPQADLLEPSDLHQAFTCINAWSNVVENQHLYAFFNSGDHSGASQPHRHLQFLPVEDMRGTVPESEWTVLCTRPYGLTYPDQLVFENPDVPVICLSTSLTTELTPEQLHDRYISLLCATAVLLDNPGIAFDKVTAMSRLPSVENLVLKNGQPKFSYNLAITEQVMTILPRRAGDAKISQLGIGEGDGESEVGTVSINGTILAGTLMVKNEIEWETLKADPTLLDELLTQIGFPKDRAKI